MDRELEPEVMDSEADAAAYDAMDHSQANSNFVDRLLELGLHGEALDIGTGPGMIPILLCGRHSSCRVVGVDLSPEMKKLAESHLTQSLVRERVTFQLADAKCLDFLDDRFDAVFSNTILHHIPDPTLFLAEAWRVLKPGGVLLIRDLFRPKCASDAAFLVEKHAAQESPSSRELFRASLYAALTPEELEKVALEAGLTSFEVIIDSDRHMSLQTRSKP
jgi:ubiquinone/menaquinone biosynthesis C-methylase UbiE